MTTPDVLGEFRAPPEQPPLSAIEMELVPIDLVTEWRRCGLIANFMADYMVYGFEHRDTARSVLSTVANELVENAAKFSSDKATTAHVSIRHYGEVVCAEIRNKASQRHVADLREVLGALASDDPITVFRRRMEDRRGLGLVLLAKDYGATVGATVEPEGAGGELAVCLRVSLSAAEVEQR